MRNHRLIIVTLALLSVGSLFLGLYIGSVSYSPSEITGILAYGIKSSLGISPGIPPKRIPFLIIWEFRLPRVLLAYLVGLSLASAGVASQALFKNPMADPYIIGVSAGASIGAAIGFVYVPSRVPEMAFLFALASVYIVYRVAKVDGRIPVDTLLLAGVAFGFIASAVTTYMVWTLGQRAHLTFMWLFGSFNGSNWRKVGEMLLVGVPSLIFLLWKWRELNLLLLGEEESIAIGLDVEFFRKVLIFLIALVTAVAVATSGIIGFVGLMAPHMARILVGPNHKRLTVNAALLGGLLMVTADLLARTVATPDEVPVGIVTAMMGGPFFLYLLRKHKRGELRA
jgi:iron complex transport system permease protein